LQLIEETKAQNAQNEARLACKNTLFLRELLQQKMLFFNDL